MIIDLNYVREKKKWKQNLYQIRFSIWTKNNIINIKY